MKPPTPRRARKKPVPHEAIFQKQVVEFLEVSLPKSARWSAIGHGAAMSVATGAKLKAMGLKKGVPDLLIVSPDVGHIWIELKAAKGTVRPEQIDWLACINAVPNSYAFVCRTVDAVENALLSTGLKLRVKL